MGCAPPAANDCLAWAYLLRSVPVHGMLSRQEDAMAFFNACSGVLTIFLVGLLGYILARKGWVAPDTAAVLPKFITTIALPPYLLRSITSSFGREQLIHLLYGAVVPFLSIFIAFFLAYMLSRALNVAKGRQGIFRTAFATSNTMNVGLPINIALFGETALPYVLLYFFANAIFFWTVGNYSIAHDGEGAQAKLFSLNTLKQICSPPLMGFACGIALVLLDLHLPEFIDKTFKYVGDMAIALSLLYIGIILKDTSLREYKFDRDIAWVLAGRFFISPALVIGLTTLITVPELMRNVFVIQSSLPVMMNAVILAGHYKADLRYATVAISLSTILSMLTIPAYMLVILYIL